MLKTFNERVTKNRRNKIISTIAMILMLTTGILAIAPIANAHTPAWTIPTYAYVSTSPNIVGVGQYTQVVFWLNTLVPTAGGTGGDLWHGFSLAVTAPDGTKSTLGPFDSDQLGSQWTTFTPNQVGNYSFVFSWPGQTLTNGTGIPNTAGLVYVGDYYQPSTSTPTILTVTQTKVQGWQEPPLPTGYWHLPLNDANRDWSQLASNWLKGSWLVGNVQLAGTAPNSAHILWQQPLTAAYPGGIVDAQWPGQPVDINDYESPWSAPIIMNGIIYYNTPPTAETAHYGYYAMDLYNGQTMWYKNGTDNGINIPAGSTIYSGLGGAGVYSGLTFAGLTEGQLYHYNAVNGQGVIGYLWIISGTTWYMLDASTGNWIMTLTNVPGGTAVTDQDGSLLAYSYNSATGNLLCWNSSQAIPPASPIGTGEQQWKPMVGATVNAVNDTTWQKWGIYQDFSAADIAPRSGYTMNVTIPTGLGSISRIIQDDNRVPVEILGFSGTGNMWLARINYHAAPYSPYPNETFTQNNNLGYTVTMLWNKPYTQPVPTGNLTYSLGASSYDDKAFTVSCVILREWWGYSLTDGSLLWGPTTPQSSWDYYGMSSVAAYGNMYSCGYGGILYCYNIKTGSLKWTYTATNIGYESPYGNYPLSIGAIADGKVILYSTEHSPTKPLWRGSYVRAINATDGTEIWKLLDFNMGLAIADGYIVSGNQYDNMIYAIGIGPSATTVSTSAVIGSTTSVMIQGTVTDQSPGAKGTPAIADKDQEAWMEYLYEQQAMPTNAAGVLVHLTAIDPNGNFQDIGTVTSDLTGNYAIMWKPPVDGMYTVTATFKGSNSYSPSSAETHFGVTAPPVAPAAVITSAPTQTVAPTSTPPQANSPSPSAAVQPPNSGMPTTTLMAIGAAVIIIVAAAAALILRRRK